MFQPMYVTANPGNVAFFTSPRTITPCIRAHDSNIVVGTSTPARGTVHLVTIVGNKASIWPYIVNTCAEGCVGGIVVDGSCTKTLDV
ncbi:hypothetical protein BD309DRAFT_1024016 [Dichomitus squalens]|uniref:Uncharacterized protein n=1 Tax=Dichomitus squalens TaxID=114155 RepID=A0A4Q9NCM2_9APHY|nr:hypothetical protein BD309DRAFT_1024016 [Dichomitus squalens]TBU51593.1 hypothetical protein BD310DRAFT_982470 [Dichomitus squalens]